LQAVVCIDGLVFDNTSPFLFSLLSVCWLRAVHGDIWIRYGRSPTPFAVDVKNENRRRQPWSHQHRLILLSTDISTDNVDASAESDILSCVSLLTTE
jgi:hypothetical protein